MKWSHRPGQSKKFHEYLFCEVVDSLTKPTSESIKLLKIFTFPLEVFKGPKNLRFLWRGLQPSLRLEDLS